MVLVGVLLFIAGAINAQEERKNTVDGGFVFKDFVEVKTTEVKNQNRSGTCWSFGSISFLESELIRSGVADPNLSEMFIVRKAYSLKADEYVRRQGKYQFGPGGQFHDVIEIIKKYGILPESKYGGMAVEYGKPVHNEMDAMAKAILDVVISNPNKKLSPNWRVAYEGTLDAYLGELPADDPKVYAERLGLNWNDYVEITSYNHEEFYKPFNLQIPDNWMGGDYYNLPIDELAATVENALKNGYSVGWDADVSEPGFSFKNGVAILPVKEWSQMDKVQKDTIFNSPSEEVMVTQELRQEMYENYETTDDHLMHITGMCKDQNGTRYYVVKNSWGTDKNDCEGYIYVSEAYFRAKTVVLLVNKASIPKGISKKLGF